MNLRKDGMIVKTSTRTLMRVRLSLCATRSAQSYSGILRADTLLAPGGIEQRLAILPPEGYLLEFELH